ncbi:uncharacterized protein LOC129583385 [Paramacrobiotus metropolitanus]|uniref:uncharacterized protein LOC129583385 n=1 Tax=Paramacrobiotus metropolitanus TaxID=2943436 RepID=UPI0024457389|nr:uncharacterized protein LOC129583385 [Paramacrobiotus metropolitanus]
MDTVSSPAAVAHGAKQPKKRSRSATASEPAKRPRQTHRPFPLPKKGNVHGTDHYDVKGILDYRFCMSLEDPSKYIVYFLVEWEGYTVAESTWEDPESLFDSWHLVKEFLQKQNKRIVIDEKNHSMEILDIEDENDEN